MSINRFITPTLALVIALAALSGCTVAPKPTPTSGATASPSPSIAYSQPAVPSSRFDFDCEEVAPLPSVAGFIGASAAPIVAYPDPTVSGGTIENMSNLANIALIQAGAVECAWTVDGSAPALTIKVIPDATSEYATLVPGLFGLPQVDGIGDRAYGGCVASGIAYCDFQVLVGGTWISITPNELVAVPQTVESITAFTRQVVSVVAKSPPATPRWTAPPTAVGASVDCASLLAASQLATLGLPAAKDLHGEGYFGGYLGDAVTAIDGGRGCAWGGVTTLILPGASWAWTSHPPLSNVSITVGPVSGLGDEAFVGCTALSGSSQCTAQMLVGTTWVGVDGPFANVGAIRDFAAVELSALQRN
ncbi:MAG TPA: hypothetical protein VGM94_00140 [Galbitalea sp.]|jgi:hypothetical protein